MSIFPPGSSSSLRSSSLSHPAVAIDPLLPSAAVLPSRVDESSDADQVLARGTLERELHQFVQSVAISSSERVAHAGFIKRIIAVAQTVLDKSAQILVFGSAASGLCERSSDIDATIKIDFATLSERFTGVRTIPVFSDTHVLCAQAVLAIADYVNTHRELNLSVKQLISGAKVPIVVLSASETLTIDISINNDLPIYNTRLLRAYAAIDERVRILVIAIKRWARLLTVSDAKAGNLSSYSWTLLCIYYLQVRGAREGGALLPSLQQMAKGMLPDSQMQLRCSCSGRFFDCRFLTDTRLKLQCASSSSDLLRGFFSFYATEFSWGHEVVSIRLGQRVSIDTHQFDALARGKLNPNHAIHIEDPLDTFRNLNCVLDVDGLARLRGAFNDMHKRISNVSATVLLQQARLLFYGKGQQPAPAVAPVTPQKPVIPPRGYYYQRSGDDPEEQRVDMW
jgi:DNA polymerase sigma